MREENAEDIPRARTSSDLNSPAAMRFDKKGNISTVINSERSGPVTQGLKEALKMLSEGACTSW